MYCILKREFVLTFAKKIFEIPSGLVLRIFQDGRARRTENLQNKFEINFIVWAFLT